MSRQFALFGLCIMSLIALAVVSSAQMFDNALRGLDETALKDGIKNIDDLEDAAKGSELVLSNHKTLDDFHKALPETERLRLIKTTGRYADDVIEKYTQVRYLGGQKFAFRGLEHSRVPAKVVDDLKVSDWSSIKKGATGINVAPKSLEYVKSLPEPERAVDARLSMAHVGGASDIFISTSASPSVAARFAKEEGYIFIFNTRSGNVLDVEKTIQKQFNNGEILRSDYNHYVDDYASEFELAFVEKVDYRDAIGLVRAKKVGGEFIIKEGSFIPNPEYSTSNLIEDMEVLKEITGGVI